MEQIHGGSIMAVLSNYRFTPEWTKRTLENLLGRQKAHGFVPRPFLPAPSVFAEQKPQLTRTAVSPAPVKSLAKDFDAPLPRPFVKAPVPDEPKAQASSATPQPPTAPQAAKVDHVEIPTAVRVKAVDVQRRQQMMVASLNLGLPKGCHVLPFAILPVDVFQGELGKFLMMACEFHAHGPANTMLLPALMEGSQYFGLPKHPLVSDPSSLADGVTKVKALRQRVAAEHQRAANAMQSGDLSRVLDRPNRQAEYRLELANIARGVAINMFGADAWNMHEARFRTTLNQM